MPVDVADPATALDVPVDATAYFVEVTVQQQSVRPGAKGPSVLPSATGPSVVPIALDQTAPRDATVIGVASGVLVPGVLRGAPHLLTSTVHLKTVAKLATPRGAQQSATGGGVDLVASATTALRGAMVRYVPTSVKALAVGQNVLVLFVARPAADSSVQQDVTDISVVGTALVSSVLAIVMGIIADSAVLEIIARVILHRT